MRRTRLPALGAALACTLVMACEDVPFVPKWDADWYVPVPSDALHLTDVIPVGTPVPPGAPSVTVADTSTQNLDESVGALLERTIRSASVIVTLSKSAALQFSSNTTVTVAASQADLSNPGANRIVVPLNITAADVSVTDTSVISAANIDMLRGVAAGGGNLFVEVRGQITYQGSSVYTIQATDSIGVRLALLARVGVSTEN
jgi:hypothetical protein